MPYLDLVPALECSCHKGFAPDFDHDGCCGHSEGRDPDCPFHGDGSGPHGSALGPIKSFKDSGAS